MEHIVIKMGEVRSARGEALLETFGVGSCVAIILFDRDRKIGGMAHAMLTYDKATEMQRAAHPLRYVELAIPALVEEMTAKGAVKKCLSAFVIGGAQMFTLYRNPGNAIGPQNVAKAKEMLASLGIPITQDDTGGTSGRNVRFDMTTGTCAIESKK